MPRLGLHLNVRRGLCTLPAYFEAILPLDRLVATHDMDSILKDYLAVLADGGLSHASQLPQGNILASRLDWSHASLPNKILERFKGTACRSAIKFNVPMDKLAVDELLEELATNRFRFQCAHGRPSTIPIILLRLME